MSQSSSRGLHELQAAFDEVLPEARRRLLLEDDLIDLGIGSIAALEIAGLLQTKLGIEIADAELLELRTVGDFVDVIEGRLESLGGR